MSFFNSDETLKEQKNILTYELLKEKKQELACELLKISGIRKVRQKYYVLNEDINNHKEEILNALKAKTYAYLDIEERRNLYQQNIENPAMVMARCILKAAGHKLTRTEYKYPMKNEKNERKWKSVSKYLLEESLLIKCGIL